jgi:hypothetical protein
MPQNAPSFATLLGHEHVSLLTHLGCLEEKPGPETEDRAAVLVGRLREVRVTLQHHFEFEEQGGYMSYFVAEDAPDLYRAAQELLAEHDRLRTDLDALITTAAALPPESLVTPALREQVRPWVQQVRKHEACENRLIYQACNQDIGTAD